jgi:hypothetical protein
MQMCISVKPEGELYEAAQKLIEAAHEFWEVAQGSHAGAVQWVEDDQGRMLVYTRSEYSQELKSLLSY